MVSLQDRRWPKGVSINSFCTSNNIPYTAFYDWFKKTLKKIVPVELEGIPEESIKTDNKQQSVAKGKPKRTSPHKGSIMVTFAYRNDGEYYIDNLVAKRTIKPITAR